MLKKVTAPQAPYVFQKFPTWATNADGLKRICQDPEDYERHTGIRVDEMGNPVDPELETPRPPTLEIVMAAGYTKEVAEKIVEEEAAKARRGEKPYGDKEPEEPKFQTGGVPVGPMAEAAALGTTPEDLKELRTMASAGEPLVKSRGKKSSATTEEKGWE